MAFIDFDTIITRLNDLTTKINTIYTNSKKIFELPDATIGQKIVAVWNATDLTTQKFDLSQALDNINQLNDRITQVGTITRDVDTFEFSVGFEWIIGGLSYQNASIVELTPDAATDDYYRIDIAVLDTNNDIVLVQGFESLTIAEQPQTLPNTLFLCSFSIFGATIGTPTSPIVGSDYVKKIYQNEINSSSLSNITLPSTGQTSFNFSVGGFDIEGFDGSSELFDGKVFVLKNSSASTINLVHNGTSTIKFKFLNESNYSLIENEIITLRYSEVRGLEILGSNKSIASTPTLQEVTDVEANTTNPISINHPTTSATIGISSEDISFINPYGLTGVSIRANEQTGNVGEILIPDAGLTAKTLAFREDLVTNLQLYPTTANSPISGYKRMVTDISDVDFDEPAVDVSTGAITGVDILISSLSSDAGILAGNPGVVNVSMVGNIRRVSGTANGVFYYKIFHRDSAGTETLIATSDNTAEVSSATYVEFSASAVWNNGAFDSTDRIVYKLYGSKIGGGSNPTFEFQFGGASPVRSFVPISASFLLQPIYEELANKVDKTTWVDYSATSTIGGFSSLTATILRYIEVGNFIYYYFNIGGVSNGATFTFTTHIAHAGGSYFGVGTYNVNNGIVSNNPPRMTVLNGSTTITILRDLSGTVWTTSGNKQVSGMFVIQKT